MLISDSLLVELQCRNETFGIRSAAPELAQWDEDGDVLVESILRGICWQIEQTDLLEASFTFVFHSVLLGGIRLEIKKKGRKSKESRNS